MNLSQKDLNHCISLDDRLCAACFVSYIQHNMSFSNYKLFSEWLGAYRWIPYGERAPINSTFALTLAEYIITTKPITPSNLFLISHYAGFIENYSAQVQLEVASCLQKLTP